MTSIPLDFKEDAICLSGLTGTKLKCEVIRDYYFFWWGITSGGPKANFSYNTAIVELNAATGEVYIEETNETVLGSSGHAMDLKVTRSPDTRNLTVVLIEENANCYSHLKNVIPRRWPSISITAAENSTSANSSRVFLLNKTLDEALDTIDMIPNLGNSLYFFDPLRAVSYSIVQRVATKRIRSFLKTGTEFFIFVFTSDWFLGRKDFAPLPTTLDETKWEEKEKETVTQADDFFGNNEWRDKILTNDSIEEREHRLIQLYMYTLHKWFRYILPLPFKPRESQVFHIILCSNFEAGVRATKDFYCLKTGNPKYAPDNEQVLTTFRKLHPELWKGIKGNRLPLQWKMLWRTIKDHEQGVCDAFCRDFGNLERATWVVQDSLDWLEKQGYILRFHIENPLWPDSFVRYRLNWRFIKDKLGIDPPAPLVPLFSGDA